MHRVEMVKFTPSVTLCMFEIQLMPVEAGRMKADSSYSYTPLGSKGDQFLERFTDSLVINSEFGIMLSSLREDVEALLPNWESWYPSLFHAAEDLGLIRARVCSPSSLLLSNRHKSVQSAALEAYREKWGGKE
jgi:hypothetical protein